MSTSDNSFLEYFARIEASGDAVVKATPKLDLDLYIQNYRGRTRFERLLLIGRTSTALCIEALKAAVAEAKKGKDIARYRQAWDCLKQASPSEPEAQFDSDWVEAREKSNQAETQRLETELKGYKNNLVKESIRMGNEDLGKHLENIGDLNGAAEAYSRMRPDVSTSKHVVEVGKHLVSISVQRREWSTVTANLNKISGLQNADEEKAIQPFLAVMHGIALLGQKKYNEAALSFFQTDAQIAPASYSEYASQNDVAIYGGLLALATMDRRDLQTKVLDAQNFRTFLELEPHIRRAISQFVNGRYSSCLAILESYRADYMCDLFLQKHIKALYSQIRSKCIVQYLKPYSCVTLDSMNAAFAISGESVEEELAGMIRTGELQARIDCVDKLVTMVSVNRRAKMQMSALDTAKKYRKEFLDRTRRMAIAAADLEVKAPRKPATGVSPNAAGGHDWLGETPIQGSVQSDWQASQSLQGWAPEYNG